MAVFATILIAFFVLFVFYLYKFSKTKPKGFPPGPPRLPIWGSYWFLLKENYYFAHKSLEMLSKRYKTDILGLYLGSAPTVTIFGYELCKEVLSRDEFIGRNDTIVTRGRSMGELLGIFSVDGPYWKEQRRFSLRHLRDYGFGRRFTLTEDLFENEVRDLIELFTSDPKPNDTDVCRKKGQILMPDIFAAPVLNSLLFMLVGRRFDNKELREVMRSIMRFLRSGDPTGCALSITPWLQHIAPDFFGYNPIIVEHKRLTDFFEKQIEEHKRNYSDDHHADMTDVYLSKMEELKNKNITNSTFSDKQLLWILIDFMFPAPVTIGNTLNYLWAYMLIDPNIQIKIQEEIDRVVGRSRLPNLDDRWSMPYTEAVILEAIRKDPLNPLGIPRKCMVDTTLGGYFIPKDTIILAHIWSAHHDPKIWTDPGKFRPERFLDDEGNLTQKDYSLAFGAGKRVCAGETFARQTLFLLVSGLMQNFTFKSADTLPDPEKKVWGILLSMSEFWVEAVSR